VQTQTGGGTGKTLNPGSQLKKLNLTALIGSLTRPIACLTPFQRATLRVNVQKPNTHFQPQTTKENNMQNETTKPQTPPPVDRESVRLLAIELGVREAARRCGLSEDRVRKWSSRYKWLEQRAPKQQQATVTVVTKPGDVLLATHKELEERTKSGLARATARAAEAAATATEPLEVSNTAHLRDLAASAARIFGWDSDKPAGSTYNTLVVTTEQLQQIRALREQADAQECPSDTPGCP
jgi:hypothetical protein